MNKFESYCASFITPQMTLLEKNNYIIKYLKENPTVNVYQCAVNYSSSSLALENLINPKEYEILVGDIVIFADGKVSTIILIGDTRFVVADTYINLKGEKGEKGENAFISEVVDLNVQDIERAEDITDALETIDFENKSISTLVFDIHTTINSDPVSYLFYPNMTHYNHEGNLEVEYFNNYYYLLIEYNINNHNRIESVALYEN